MRFRVLLALLCGAAADSSAQSKPSLTAASLLPSADLRADLATLRKTFVALHPGLYRYTTPVELAARFDSVDRYFERDRSLGEAFVVLTRLTATIQCGHTYPNFWNQRDDIANALFEQRNKVPFEFRWIDGEMVVTNDRTTSGALPRGTRVLAINGTASRKVLDALLPLARADGANDGKRIAYLEIIGQGRYEAFDVMYPQLFPVSDTLFTLNVRLPGKRSASMVQVPSLTASQRRTTVRSRASESATAPIWSYIERNETGVLTMPTWSLYDSKWDWKAWIDSLMEALIARGLRDLVLDVRGNEGGLDAGNAILAHLIDQPVSLPLYRRYVRYRKVPADLVSLLDTWDRGFLDWAAAAEGPDTTGFYRLRKWDDDTSGAVIVQPRGPRYTGRVWVLVDPSNSSATFQFANAMKQLRLGTLVGRATGGNLRGINGSAFFFVRLPRTGLEVDLPLVAMKSPSAQENSGIEPDIVARTTPSDIARGVDSELMTVLSRIERLRK